MKFIKISKLEWTHDKCKEHNLTHKCEESDSKK